MKKIFAKLSILMLIITAIFGAGNRVSAEENPDNKTVHNMQEDKDNVYADVAEQIARDYFTKREAYLQGKSDESEMGKLVNSGVLEDEKNHRDSLSKPFSADSIIITSINAWDDEARVVAEEFRNGNQIQHKITMVKNEEDNWIIISDRYLDPCDNFKSASYVDEKEAAQILKQYEMEQTYSAIKIGKTTRAMMSNNSDQMRNLLVSIANNQIGYYEKYKNESLDDYTAFKGGNGAGYTKYGQWACGSNCAWCAAFVSWCANQAEISTSIIPNTIWVQNTSSNYNSFFINAGRYHARGTYTPKKGDVFLITGSDGSHVGIVASVSGSTMVVVHGNTRAGETYYHVATEVFSITETGITGFGNPDYCMGNNHSGNYSHNDSKHWRTCTVCGINTEGIHEWVSMGSYYRCRVCGRTATNVSGPIYNGTVPADR